VATTEDIEEGCVVIDLGGGVTDVTVMMGGKVRYMASIPIGTDAINGDIRAYGIPANYIESLKRQYGSAMQELATDDKIVFQSARRGTTKSILRRNLASIIEARMCEIAEWVRREIKNAGCGKDFQPVVLLTGGGAEMQHIEELFAR
jgi:cell division protein FtsA